MHVALSRFTISVTGPLFPAKGAVYVASHYVLPELLIFRSRYIYMHSSPAPFRVECLPTDSVSRSCNARIRLIGQVSRQCSGEVWGISAIRGDTFRCEQHERRYSARLRSPRSTARESR